MSLAAGVRLGPYEIQSPLGAGGMGEVYRARDTRLQRDVAIKVLPETLALDPERLARFEREAQLLASLNHPNIAHVYGVEDSSGVRALAMELVEGPTLADRIAHGPMPLDELLPIAKQIAEALEAAHEHGIIHRDLKPANIKVRDDGAVKVLDFGLAKALDSTGVTSSVSRKDLTMSPTLSVHATLAGVILGTAAYMSPEQARGRTVDRRADIWAFGAVLYEMLTGRRAFDGDDLSMTLANVLKAEPDWSALPADTPVALRRLLTRCLKKDPKERLQAIGDARIDIGEILSGTAESPMAAGAGPAGSTGPGGQPLWRRAMPWAVASVLLAGLAVVSVIHFGEVPPAAPLEMRTEIVTLPTTDLLSFALSPDGRQLVFVASDDGPSRLWLRSLAAATAQPLAGTEGAASPFWSPDSRSIGFFAEGRLKRLDLGGAPQILTTTANASGGTWNADGVIVFARNTAGPLFRMTASGGEAVAVTMLDRQTSHRWPHFLPDGRHFFFLARGTPEADGIHLGSLDSQAPTRLAAADAGGVYLPSGWVLWVRGGTLVAQRLDLERRALTGDLVTVADTVGFDGNTRSGAFSVSAMGLVGYRTGEANRRQLHWFDRTGKMLGALGPVDDAGLSTVSLSPDGRRVAVSRTLQGNTDIWLLNGIRTSRFTFDAAVDRSPQWSNDGSRIVFWSNRQGPRNLYVGMVNSPGSEALLLESPQDKTVLDWSTDGRFFLYQISDPQTGLDLWVMPLDGDRKPWLFLKTNFDERGAEFSPDGRWVAYESNESGREIYVRPFVAPGGSIAPDRAPANRGGGQWQVSTAGGIHPRWRADGRELYYLAPDGQMMAAAVTAAGTAFEVGTPVALFQTRIVGGGVQNNQNRQYDVSRDGRFLINMVLDDAAAPITLLQNWTPPVK